MANFNARKEVFTDDRFTSFRDLGKRTLEYISDDNNERLYKNGYPVEQLFSGDVRGYLSLPQKTSGEGCVWTSPLKFQEDSKSTCHLTSHQVLCTETSVLSARMYLQGSSLSYPACPDAPQVVSKYRSSQVAPTNVYYYCTDDVTPYMISNMTLKDALNPTKPSFFMEDMDDGGGNTYPRCSWDDGYSRPPIPTYDNTTELCQNAVLDVDYQLYWRGGEIISVEATLLLGAIGLQQDAQEQTEEETDTNFISPPPITAPPTTGQLLTSIIFENETEIITNFTDVFENFTFTLGTEGTPGTESTVTMGPTTVTVAKTTANPTTTPVPPTTTPVPPTTKAPTTQSIPTTIAENPERGDNPDLPVLPATTPTPVETTMASSTPTQTQQSNGVQSQTDTYPSMFIQYFSAKFVHLPETTSDPNTGQVTSPGEQSKRSGNPGYIIGSRVLTGVAVYDYLPDYDCPENSTDYSDCILAASNTGINGTFVVVEDVEDNRLKVWAPGKN